MRKSLAAAAAVLVVFIGYSLFLRVRAERADRRVEICVDWNGTSDLLWAAGVSGDAGAASPDALRTFLERCKIIGVSAVVLQEETLQDLIDSGKVLYFRPQDAESYKALGLATEGVLNPDQLWVRKDPDLLRRISESLQAYRGFSGGPAALVEQKKPGGYAVLQNKISSWEPFLDLKVGAAPEDLALLSQVGLLFVEKLEPSRGALAWSPRIEADDARRSAWLWTGPVPGGPRDPAPPASQLSDLADKSRAAWAEIEGRVPPGGKLAGFWSARPGRVWRAHTIAPEELQNLSARAAEERWVRAVRERSCRLLYFRWNPDWSLDQNLGLLRDVAQKLKSQGYVLGALPREGENAKDAVVALPLRKIRLALAFLAALAGPLLALYGLRRGLAGVSAGDAKALAKAWLCANALALAGGLLVAALLPDGVFVSGLDVFRGVKPALALPPLFSIFILYPPHELKDLVRRKITLLDAAAFAILAAAFVVMLQRSGNFASAPSGLELRLRAVLEGVFGARPRFKEFLIGQPLLILGAVLSLRRPRPAGEGPLVLSEFPQLCLIGGSVGLASIVNSFCHLHTPIAWTLLRSFHGIWIGGLLGAVLVRLLWVGDAADPR